MYNKCLVPGGLAMQTKLQRYLASGTTIVSSTVGGNALYSLLTLACLEAIISVDLGVFLICNIFFNISPHLKKVIRLIYLTILQIYLYNEFHIP